MFLGSRSRITASLNTFDPNMSVILVIGSHMVFLQTQCFYSRAARTASWIMHTSGYGARLISPIVQNWTPVAMALARWLFGKTLPGRVRQSRQGQKE
jgi:hypothetical protein